MEAPLSSPTATAHNQAQPSYFTRSSTASTSSSSSAQPGSYSSFSHAQQPQMPASQPAFQQQQQVQTQQAQTQVQQPQDQTAPFLRDFNLVAEAAKRAQMAVLMRDMEAVGL